MYKQIVVNSILDGNSSIGTKYYSTHHGHTHRQTKHVAVIKLVGEYGDLIVIQFFMF